MPVIQVTAFMTDEVTRRITLTDAEFAELQDQHYERLKEAMEGNEGEEVSLEYTGIDNIEWERVD